jgi:RNA polymerase sigma factor (sigma-70 family)
MTSALVQRQVLQDGKRLGDELSDESLLERYLTGEESDAQEAFRALVVRHGPMVLGICRHVLNEHHDAEDAFQATFLVLAQKGASIQNRRVLAGWLHEVAHRIAIKARASAARRNSVERKGKAMAPQVIESNRQHETAAWNELRPILHAEVERLPEKYRVPVILSYLEGKTNEEVAELLQWPVGTVKGRLSRARDLLRSRLSRRGLSLSAAFLVTALAEGRVFAEVVPQDLVQKTVRLVGRFGPRSASASSGSSAAPSGHDLSAEVESLSRAGRVPKRFIRKAWGWPLFSVAIVLVSVGIAAAAVNRGGFSNFRSALSALLPSRIFGTGGGCH